MTEHSFFKYCPVYRDDRLDEEYSIINLLASQVTFSTRNNFNDPFDSTLDFVMPTTEELEQACEQLTGEERVEFSELYLSDNAPKALEMQVQKLNQKFERYMYYCCLLYTSPSPRDRQKSRMPSSA